ncbi:MAG: glycine cleavage T C-terminal barrel domain-containing protein [Acidimicrobiales bacterium]
MSQTPVLGLEETYACISEAVSALETARDVVVVTGPDARTWLQGQVSQDLAALGPGHSAETLVLSPQGKVDAYCRATMLTDEIVLLDTETGYGELLEQRLRRFRLRVRAELESGTLRCLEVRGPDSATSLAGSQLEPGTAPAEIRGDTLSAGWIIAVPVTWPGFAGFDVMATAATTGWPLLKVPLGDPAAFEAARIEAGVPAMGRELTEKTIPQEAGSLVEHTVSFTKGCYTGQELVARLDSRGANVARKLRGVVIDPAGQGQGGATLTGMDRELGSLTSVAWSPRFASPVALAYVRRDVVLPAVAKVTPGGADAEIRELPL